MSYSSSYVKQKNMCNLNTGPNSMTPAITDVHIFLPPSTTLPYKQPDCYGSYFRPTDPKLIQYVDISQYKTTPWTTKFPSQDTKCKSCSA